MNTIRTDEITLACELVTNLRAAIEFKTYHSDCVPTLSDLLADWLVTAEREREQSAAEALVEPASIRGS